MDIPPHSGRGAWTRKMVVPQDSIEDPSNRYWGGSVQRVKGTEDQRDGVDCVKSRG